MINEIHVRVSFKNFTLVKKDAIAVEGDYNTTKLVFEFEENVANRQIKFGMTNPQGELVMFTDLINNEIILVSEDENGNVCSVFNSAGMYVFHVYLMKEGNLSQFTSPPGYFPVVETQVNKSLKSGIALLTQLMRDVNALKENSGEGAKGEKGDKGDPGEKGADGVSVTHSWDGTVLTVTSASGTSSADLKGDKGEDGNFDVGSTVVSKYYSIDVATFKNYGVLDFAITTNGSELNIVISTFLGVVENEVVQPLTDIPFNLIVGQTKSILLNKEDFKSVGLISPFFEAFGITGYVSFDAFAQLLLSQFCESSTVNIKYDEQMEYIALNISVSVKAEYIYTATYLASLCEQLLNMPDTKLVFEYQKQENIETQEATYQLSATPIIDAEV